MKMILTLIKNI
jgi:hypothetical protein